MFEKLLDRGFSYRRLLKYEISSTSARRELRQDRIQKVQHKIPPARSQTIK